VGCGSEEAQYEFLKNGFAYSRCVICGTLYQSPRPTIGAFEHFYRNSESARYWAEVFFPSVAEVRRNKIFRPRVERLASMCAAKGIVVERMIDVGAGFGIFLDEWRHRFPATEVLAIEPSTVLASECRSRGFEVIEDIVENVIGYDGYADLIICFEVLEHVYEPLNFVRTLSRLVRPGGYVFISTLGVDGFDIQMLWERSNSIFPPHHINFLSVEGFQCLFARAGLEQIEVTTPGQLDVDIVVNALDRNPTLLNGQRFLLSLLKDKSHSIAFQQFLAANNLSSHTWVIGKRAE
jgi:SAM-dependent methyltransferase